LLPASSPGFLGPARIFHDSIQGDELGNDYFSHVCLLIRSILSEYTTKNFVLEALRFFYSILS
jgi:hypothetical protein